MRNVILNIKIEPYFNKMSGYNTYSDTDHSFLESQNRSAMTPLYPDFWRNDPLNPDTLIDPKRAGYRPIFQYVAVTKQNPFIDSSCPVFQNECDLILPVNKCYIRNPQEWLADIFRGR